MLSNPNITIQRVVPETPGQWTNMRSMLWPGASSEELAADVRRMLHEPERYAAFLARVGVMTAGFAEVSIRSDYVNGTQSSPAAFLEGLYVRPEYRRRGIARLLCEAVERWAADLGYAELASDALLENTDSHAMHAALGFAETERVVYFRKPLPS